MNKFKKKLITVGVAVAILSAYTITIPNYETNYELLDNSPAFAKCNCGTVYIGNKNFLKSIPKDSNVILVEDKRRTKEPDMIIYDSCRICSKEDRNEILEILQEYERQDPSDWDRTIDSMRLEWLMHNISYDLNIDHNRTTDVDLDNEDEEKYSSKILQYLFRVK